MLAYSRHPCTSDSTGSQPASADLLRYLPVAAQDLGNDVLFGTGPSGAVSAKQARHMRGQSTDGVNEQSAILYSPRRRQTAYRFLRTRDNVHQTRVAQNLWVDVVLCKFLPEKH